jgi:hypothetical protein
MKTDKTVSQLFPPVQRQALVRAAAGHDLREIDRITDTLALMGLCRRRSAGEWERRRGFQLPPDGGRIINEFESEQ